MATELPATLSIPFPNNIIYSPTATQKLGGDYNRHPGYRPIHSEILGCGRPDGA